MSLGSTRRSPTISWFLLILANVLWACSYVAAKYVLRDISANMMNALRMMIAALVLLPLQVKGAAPGLRSSFSAHSSCLLRCLAERTWRQHSYMPREHSLE